MIKTDSRSFRPGLGPPAPHTPRVDRLRTHAIPEHFGADRGVKRRRRAPRAANMFRCPRAAANLERRAHLQSFNGRRDPPGHTIAGMKAWTKGAVVVALGFVACRPYTTFPSSHRGLRLTTPQLAKQYGRDLKHVDRPFQLVEQGVNGTGVLMTFFQELEQASGAYVSDVSYALQMTYDGKNIECVSRIRVDDGTPEPAAEVPTDERDGEPEYTTTVKAWRPRTVDASVVDRELKCQQHAQQVIEDAPKYDSVYGAETRLYIPPGRMP